MLCMSLSIQSSQTISNRGEGYYLYTDGLIARVKKSCQYRFPFACSVQMAFCQKTERQQKLPFIRCRSPLAVHTCSLDSALTHSLICVEVDDLES